MHNYIPREVVVNKIKHAIEYYSNGQVPEISVSNREFVNGSFTL